MMKLSKILRVIAFLMVVTMLCCACGEKSVKTNNPSEEVQEPVAPEPIVIVTEKEEEPKQPEQPEQPEQSEQTETKREPNNFVVVLDPGHQRRGDSKKEPNGPGSSKTKARVTGGTTGVATGVPEYKLTLQIAKKVKKELESRGYTVYMTRTSHDVNISNKERAEFATEKGADIAVRIHANGSSSASANGAEMLTPSLNNPYIKDSIVRKSQKLSTCILDEYCKKTDFKKRGVYGNDTMTGINWSQVPVTIIEMGFMSNAAEDRAMQKSSIQKKMVQGIANGIDKYFGF